MAKTGKSFELVVSDVVREMDAQATVQQGEWVEGPDGRREVDVLVEGMADGRSRRVLIECKDYNPLGRPLGIGFVDSLDSKRRDLKADVALLCSNAGFSIDAIRKASRVGIGLIGVLRENDPRIRYRVVDEVYIRRVNFVAVKDCIKIDWLTSLPTQGALRLEQIKFDDLPVGDWLTHRAFLFVSHNPIVSGRHSLMFRFKQPIPFKLPNGFFLATRLHLTVELSGEWIAQRLEIDATSGLYDWMHHAIRVGPAAGRILYKDVKFGIGGTPIDLPPNFDPASPQKLLPDEVAIRIADVGGIILPKAWPELERFVVEEDLAEPRKLPLESYRSGKVPVDNAENRSG